MYRWLCILALMGAVAAGGEAAPRPNLVMVVADDLGYADVSWHGGEAPMPHLDGLAADGLRLEAHYSTPWCSPSRVALLTGRQPSRLGIGLRGRGEHPELPAAVPTLGEVLSEGGYETVICGKWHVGDHPDNRPLARGFKHQYGLWGGSVGYFSHRGSGNKPDWRRNDQPVRDQGHATRLLADEAIRRIRRRNQARPLFLYLPFTAPHSPLQPPSGTGTPRERYLALVADLDVQIGRILGALDEEGLLANTLVVFQSDNGGVTKVANNAPLRAGKLTSYEGGVRVPAFAWWPGRVRSGMTNELTHTIDWLPTLCDAAGITVPASVDGRSLLPLFESSAVPHPDGLLLAHTRYGMAYRRGEWKALRSGRDPWQLFNVVNDPGETEDRAAEFPELTAELALSATR